MFYWNTGKAAFQDLSKSAGPGCTAVASSSGLAMADLWNDGRISAVVNDVDAEPKLLVNEALNKNHWLGVALVGSHSNRESIGAKVSVATEGRTVVQEVRSGSSYLSSSDLRLHFGLGSASRVGQITIRWPNGQIEEFPGAAADQILTLTEGSGKARL